MSSSDRINQEKKILGEINASLSMMNTVDRQGERGKVIYASSPITTGRRMYEAFVQYGVTSTSELKKSYPDVYRHTIMDANIADGVQFGNVLQQRDPNSLIIVPGVFFVKGWAQKHYIALWRQVIERHADVIQFNTDWYLSNGCAQEFLIGLQNRIPLLEKGKNQNIGQKEGAEKIAKGIRYVVSLGIDPTSLCDIYREVVLWRQQTTTAFS